MDSVVQIRDELLNMNAHYDRYHHIGTTSCLVYCSWDNISLLE